MGGGAGKVGCEDGKMVVPVSKSSHTELVTGGVKFERVVYVGKMP